jgi:hypothetical protein
MADLIFPGATPPPPVLGATRLPSNYDLAIWQGDSWGPFDIEVTGAGGTPVSLSGRTPTAVIRETLTSEEEWVITCTVNNDNHVQVYMPSAVTKTMEAGSYVWNLQMTDTNGDVRTYLAGDVTVYAEVDH